MAKQFSRRTVFVMAAASGVSIANLYFCHPLLEVMAQSFHVADSVVKWVPALTQLGAALGIVVMMPLGDRVERRSLTVKACLALSVSSLLVAISPRFGALAASSLCLGFFCLVPHLILPMAALLAPKEQSGRVIGTVMSGLLVGVLAGRTFSGFIGGTFGWRVVYWLSAAITAIMAWLIHRELPQCHSPQVTLSYPQLLVSAFKLFRYRQLVEAAFIGAMLFGAFNAFWTTLVFFLSTPPYHYGARMAGAMGMLAVGSAVCAPVMGRVVDRHSPRYGVGWAIMFLLASFGVLYLLGTHLWGLAIGVVMLDAAAQCGHTANLARVYVAFGEARSRAGTAYLVCFFGGAAIGTCLGGWGWFHLGWAGVCLAGAGMAVAALLMQLWSCWIVSVRPDTPFMPALRVSEVKSSDGVAV